MRRKKIEMGKIKNSVKKFKWRGKISSVGKYQKLRGKKEGEKILLARKHLKISI